MQVHANMRYPPSDKKVTPTHENTLLLTCGIKVLAVIELVNGVVGDT